MTRTLLHLALFFSLPCLVRAVAAAETIVVELPRPESNVKLFEFPGGTPEQFIAQLRKTYGSFGKAVTMEDQTGGQALPAAKIFAGSILEAAHGSLGQRLRINDNNDLIHLIFRKPAGTESNSQAGPAIGNAGAVAAEPAKTILFHFPGGTPAELIAALDAAFSCHLAEIATIAPDAAELRIPDLRMKAGEALEVLEKLNIFSADSYGAAGYWNVGKRNGDKASTAAEADCLLVTPNSRTYNPPPATIAVPGTASSAKPAPDGPEVKLAALQVDPARTHQAPDPIPGK